MIEFRMLEKKDKETYLPKMFDLLYRNMEKIAPSGERPGEMYEDWHGEVAPALDKPARNVVLIFDDDRFIGYFQYYVNREVFMMEEIQFEPAYMGTGLFEKLYRYLFEILPRETPYVEAYAHKSNTKSQGILVHLGLERIGENANGSCFRYRGSYQKLQEMIGKENK